MGGRIRIFEVVVEKFGVGVGDGGEMDGWVGGTRWWGQDVQEEGDGIIVPSLFYVPPDVVGPRTLEGEEETDAPRDLPIKMLGGEGGRSHLVKRPPRFVEERVEDFYIDGWGC